MTGGYALGIDLGSKYTAAALYRDGTVAVAQLGDHAHVIPTVVYIRADGEYLVGEAARRRAETDPSASAQDFKRDLANDEPHFFGEHAVTSAQLTAAVIRHVVQTVTEREGAVPANVTITCPASWGAQRRGELAKAADNAGLPEAGLLEEPVAAAMHYASLAHRRVTTGTLLGVYDLGGATFDVAIVRKTADGFAACGRPDGADLGGMDFDQIVLDHVLSHVPGTWSDKASRPTDRAVDMALARLRADAIDRKEALSLDTEVCVPVLLPGITNQVRLTREEFEQQGAPLVAETIETFCEVLQRSEITVDQLDRLLLVGGASRMPVVARMLAARLPGVQLHVDEHPKWAVCLGAAIAAGVRLTTTRTPTSTSSVRLAPPAEEDDLDVSAFAPPIPATGSPGTASAAEDALLVVDAQPPPVLELDLTEMGLGGIADVPLRSALVHVRPVEIQEQFVVEVTGTPGLGMRTVVLATVAVLAVIVLVVLIGVLR